MDLSRYESNELIQGSLHLLDRLYTPEITLFSKAIQTQLLVNEQSKQVFTEIEDLLPTLRRYMSIDAGEIERGGIIRMLNTLTTMCSLEQEEEEPHQQNQRIVYNSGK